MTNNFVPAQHPRAKDKPNGQAPSDNLGGFVPADPKTEAPDTIGAQLVAGFNTEQQAVRAANSATVSEATRDVIDTVVLPGRCGADAKFPTATEIQIWNAGEDEGGSSFEVELIRDAVGTVLWRCDTGVETAFEYEVNGYALGLDRFGIDALAQKPGSGGTPWTGLIVADRPADAERSEPNAEISSMLAADTATVREATVNVIDEVSAAFPEASEIQIWNAGEDEGESSFEVEEIRTDTGRVIYSKDKADDYSSPFTEKVNGWALELDRFGIDALAQKPGSAGAPWTGIVIPPAA